MKKQTKVLFDNTLMLYILTFSTQLINLVTIPYLTRVLGPSVYGMISLATAYMFYVQLFLDFGMILHATRLISQCRSNPGEMERVISGVMAMKVLLALLLGVALGVAAGFNTTLREQAGFYGFYLAAYLAGALLPDFYYRGIERMRFITMRTLAARSLFTMIVFIFIHGPEDVMCVPLFLMMSNLLALGIALHDLIRSGLKLRRPRARQISDLMKGALPYFGSRMASTFYQGLNTVLLGAVYGQASPVLGYYGAADKAISLIKTCSSPVADSLFPYMLKNKDFRLVRLLLYLSMPVIVLGVAVVYWFAEPLCLLAFGAEYGESAQLLRMLLPAALVIFPSYVLCFPVLVPMGLQKYANLSNVVGLAVQVVGFGVLTAVNQFNVYAICALTSLSEVLVFAFRLGVFLRFRNRLDKMLTA